MNSLFHNVLAMLLPLLSTGSTNRHIVNNLVSTSSISYHIILFISILSYVAGFTFVFYSAKPFNFPIKHDEGISIYLIGTCLLCFVFGGWIPKIESKYFSLPIPLALLSLIAIPEENVKHAFVILVMITMIVVLSSLLKKYIFTVGNNGAMFHRILKVMPVFICGSFALFIISVLEEHLTFKERFIIYFAIVIILYFLSQIVLINNIKRHCYRVYPEDVESPNPIKEKDNDLKRGEECCLFLLTVLSTINIFRQSCITTEIFLCLCPPDCCYSWTASFLGCIGILRMAGCKSEKESKTELISTSLVIEISIFFITSIFLLMGYRMDNALIVMISTYFSKEFM